MKTNRRYEFSSTCFTFITLVYLLCVFSTVGFSQTQPFIKGADISFLPQIEKYGGVFRDSGNVKDAIQIFKDHGFNYIRLRIWNSPALPDTANDLAHTLQLARRAKQFGLRILLDFHYSDWWADPLHQTKPAAWSSLSFSSLKDSVYKFSKNVITALKHQNTLPEMVQIGNEIICGMLWDDGKVCGSYNTPAQWNKLAQLLNAGSQGIHDALSPSDSLRIMIHIDRGGDNGSCQWFYNNLISAGVAFDIIGLSYYPWWHGNLAQLSANLTDLSTRYNKDIIVVETSFPWTLQWNDNVNNIVGDSSQELSGYPATVSGQQAFLADEISIIRQTINNKGIGVFYWEPDWITAPSLGSGGENLALFDFQGNALSSFRSFDSPVIQVSIQAGWNIVSSPTLSFDQSKSVLYPASSTPAYTFTSVGYKQQDTLHYGKGYWIKYASPHIISFKGDSLLNTIIEVQAGWNMIGALSFPITIANITQSPENNIQSQFYRYGTGYETTDTLLPGKGYWIKVRESGQLMLKK